VRYGVLWLWLVEPIECVLKAYWLEANEWSEIGRYTSMVQADIPPFDTVPFELGNLWIPTDMQ